MPIPRFKPEDTALLLVDHQAGLANGIQDQSIPEFLTSLGFLLKVGKVFNLPTIATTSASDGPNGPLMPIVGRILPDVKVVHRPGEINAWDNAEFVEAVKATGRKNLIVAGISTEVCANFVAISAVSEGFNVHVIVDACGTWNKLVQEVAIARMAQAGVVPNTAISIGAELQADWRNPTAEHFGPMMAEHLPFYGNLIGSFMAAQG
jgi:nicotinamidase-related amidase